MIWKMLFVVFVLRLETQEKKIKKVLKLRQIHLKVGLKENTMKILSKIKATVVALIATIFVIKYLQHLESIRVWDYEVDKLLEKYNL